jgi:hypothetical protein
MCTRQRERSVALMDPWMHQLIALDRCDRWLRSAAATPPAGQAHAQALIHTRNGGRMSETSGAKPELRTRVRQRFDERRAIRADRRARRKAKIGFSRPEDAADIASAAQVRGGFFTTDPGPRP